jgi:hypothetical protein
VPRLLRLGSQPRKLKKKNFLKVTAVHYLNLAREKRLKVKFKHNFRGGYPRGPTVSGGFTYFKALGIGLAPDQRVWALAAPGMILV